MSLWPFFRAPSIESGMMDEFSSSMRQMDRYMREMEHSMNDMTRRMNMQLPVDMRSRQAEAWHIENPVVTDNDGNRKLQLRFDVRQFLPEEINVKTKDGKLEVHATHDKKWDNSEVHHEYHRVFTLPEGMNPETLKSALNRDGVLVIEAPLEALPESSKESILQIQHEK